MTVDLRQAINGNVLPLLLLIVGFSQLLPDGMFSLMLGIVLFVGSAFLYWSKTGSNS